MVPKDLHRRFRVRVECRFETKLGDTNLFEKGFDGTDEVTEGEVVVCDEALYLMKFAQMRGVHGFVTEHAVDGEVTCGFEASWLVGEFVEHLGRYGGGVCSEKILECLCDGRLGGF